MNEISSKKNEVESTEANKTEEKEDIFEDEKAEVGSFGHKFKESIKQTTRQRQVFYKSILEMESKLR